MWSSRRKDYHYSKKGVIKVGESVEIVLKISKKKAAGYFYNAKERKLAKVISKRKQISYKQSYKLVRDIKDGKKSWSEAY